MWQRCWAIQHGHTLVRQWASLGKFFSVATSTKFHKFDRLRQQKMNFVSVLFARNMSGGVFMLYLLGHREKLFPLSLLAVPGSPCLQMHYFFSVLTWYSPWEWVYIWSSLLSVCVCLCLFCITQVMQNGY